MDATPETINDSNTSIHPDPQNAATEKELTATERYGLDILTTGAAKLFPLLNDMDCAVSQLRHGSRVLPPTSPLNRVLTGLASTYNNFAIDAIHALAEVEKEIMENYPQFLDGDDDPNSRAVLQDMSKKVHDIMGMMHMMKHAAETQRRSSPNESSNHGTVGREAETPANSPTA